MWAILLSLNTLLYASQPDVAKLPAGAAVEPTALESISHARDSIDTVLSPAEECPLELAPVQFIEEHMGKPNLSVSEYWHRTSCAELLADEPPAWLAGKISESEKNWLPICSLSYLQVARQHSPQAPLAALLQESIQKISTFDQCPRQIRDNEDSGEPKQTIQADPQKPRPGIPLHRRKEIESIKDEALGSVTAYCCPKNSSIREKCLDSMKGITTSWCLNSASCPATARESDAWYTDIPYKADHSIELNADDISEWALPESIASTLTHELGHACFGSWSFYSMKSLSDYLAHKRTFSDNVKLKNGRAGEGCSISKEYEKLTRQMFQGLRGGNREVHECVLKLANQSTRRRFEPEACVACPSQQFYEAFGEWTSLVAVPEKYRGQQLIWSFCSGVRDYMHPMTADVLKCALKSSILRKQITKDLGCELH